MGEEAKRKGRASTVTQDLELYLWVCKIASRIGTCVCDIYAATAVFIDFVIRPLVGSIIHRV